MEPLTPTTTNRTPATAGGEGKLKTLVQSGDFKTAVARSLPRHLSPDRFVRVALTAMTRTPKLMGCDQASFFNALLTLSQLGLEPDGRNAHLIPFENRNRGVTECQLIIDYKGLVDLAMRSGNIAAIHADKVCDRDEFEYDRGELKKHKINFREARGDAYAYYALVRFKDGAEKCEVMTKDDVNKIRERSRAKNNGPWQTDYDEMAKKTVFRRLTKWIQLSPEYRDALEHDGDALEERRFENALPAIARPVIGNGSEGAQNGAAAEQPQPEPPAEKPAPRSRKTAAKQPAAPKEPDNAQKLAIKLEEAGFTPRDLLTAAIANKWIDAPKGYAGTPEELDQVPLASIGDEKLAMLLEEWESVAENIRITRGDAPTPERGKGDALFPN